MIILGDNPFFGINHASVSKSQAYRKGVQLLDWNSAHCTMQEALALGVDHLMLTTHPEAPSLLTSMSVDPQLSRFKIVPAVPYLHRLNGIVASKGIPAALARSISYKTLARDLLGGATLTAAGLVAFLEKESLQVRQLGFHTPYLALQNIFVDLLIGLGQADIINEVGERFARSGLRLVAITMNPLIADKFLDQSVVLCTHYNYLGYMVQPDLAAFQSWLAESVRQIWAMGIMSSGRAKPANVFGDPNLKNFSSVVVGASRPESIASTVRNYAAMW